MSSPVRHNSGQAEWYTPAEYIEAARTVLGGIDLDPASCSSANEVVRAATFYDQRSDGLAQPWFGRVWMNPPYGANHMAAFCARLAEAIKGGAVSAAIVLTNNATETRWFGDLAAAAAAVCFPAKRIRFWSERGQASQPLQGQAFLYAGPDPDRFRAEFSRFGWTALIDRQPQR